MRRRRDAQTGLRGIVRDRDVGRFGTGSLRDASPYLTSPTHPLRIYSADLLRDAGWVGEVWYSPANDRHGPALTSDPMDINRKLAPPQTFANTFASGQIDLSGFHEVYVHCPTLSDSSVRRALGPAGE